MKLNVCRSDYAVNYGKTIMGLPNGISDDLICARNRNPPSDTCQGMKKLEVIRCDNFFSFTGDSGSGLQMLKDRVYYIHGITSFGVSCNSPRPSFYTRVMSVVDWIEEKVWT